MLKSRSLAKKGFVCCSISYLHPPTRHPPIVAPSPHEECAASEPHCGFHARPSTAHLLAPARSCSRRAPPLPRPRPLARASERGEANGPQHTGSEGVCEAEVEHAAAVALADTSHLRRQVVHVAAAREACGPCRGRTPSAGGEALTAEEGACWGSERAGEESVLSAAKGGGDRPGMLGSCKGSSPATTCSALGWKREQLKFATTTPHSSRGPSQMFSGRKSRCATPCALKWASPNSVWYQRTAMRRSNAAASADASVSVPRKASMHWRRLPWGNAFISTHVVGRCELICERSDGMLG